MSHHLEHTYTHTIVGKYTPELETERPLEKWDMWTFFSPNGDGINDQWADDSFLRYPDNEVWIYNRSGQLVFNEVNYQNNWSGQYNNEDLPEGSYYYIIDFNRSGNPDYQGIVYLAR